MTFSEKIDQFIKENTNENNTDIEKKFLVLCKTFSVMINNNETNRALRQKYLTDYSNKRAALQKGISTRSLNAKNENKKIKSIRNKN